MEAGGGPLPPTPEEELLGLRESVAQLERKLGTRFYALAAATTLALAAGIVGIVLSLGVKDDSATKGDLKQLRSEVAGVEESASTAADDELADLGDRVSELESQVRSLRSDQDGSAKEISVLQDDVADLREEVANQESAPPDDSADSK